MGSNRIQFPGCLTVTGMAKTRSMTRKHNHNGDAESVSSSRKRIKASDKDGVASWSDINHDVLFIVMMKLRVVDFLSFSRVCKSWRSFTLSNRITFMASRPPMSIDIHHRANNQDSCCYLKEFKGRRFKIMLPHSAGRLCIGVTCGYLIFFGSETRDFWLLNPITRHKLHFPHYPLHTGDGRESIRAILVFSDSISGWVLVTLPLNPSIKQKISFCIAGKRGWKHVSSAHSIIDLHAFKGKIYTLGYDLSLRELRLNLKQKTKSTFLKITNIQMPLFLSELVSSSENLYVVYRRNHSFSHVLKLDFGEMEWVLPEKAHGEYAFFHSYSKSSAAIKLGSWPDPLTQCKRLSSRFQTDEIQQLIFFYRSMWYIPHDCLNVNLLNEY